MTRIAIHGAAGRMGKRLVALGSDDPELAVVAAIERDDHPAIGQDAGAIAGVAPLGVPLGSEIPEGIESVIDFSVPAAAESITRRCLDQRLPLVMATTGLSDEQCDLVRSAADTIPVVWAPNMSLAVNLTMNLTQAAARALRDLPGGADVEVIERHHRYKEDAPSGTALRFGSLIADVMGQDKHQHGREGITGQRTRDEIGYHALRVGDNPGEHTIVFGMLGETIELTVRATNRDCYAMGALAAAKFVAGQPAGVYNMNDVLGLQ
ncbi:MAG: 4-hydroxy-tetrahydrodipicolinate reductase [Pirellulaceae bacterium]|jgi:4-hydroxy-tetrahydrodipicolinate reductase|nr:4-hydroxy-tetrahydrodipicolinate reductase [Pirellulaceae bacterium]